VKRDAWGEYIKLSRFGKYRDHPNNRRRVIPIRVIKGGQRFAGERPAKRERERSSEIKLRELAAQVKQLISCEHRKAPKSGTTQQKRGLSAGHGSGVEAGDLAERFELKGGAKKKPLRV